MGGDARLSGLVRVGGAKNAVLALLAGTLACAEPVTLTNVPDLRDVRSMIAVLESVGAGRCARRADARVRLIFFPFPQSAHK